ncbi:unnamed protein product [Blepharisma stoltei]|uniref:Uncharacterized protein n=1 Tax=Blepharisma stoltei TaxID=1481888 RepID=A0AAU9I992_9CILI|nr:unnamed protein product [Blepharisma stoltei]
MLDNPKKGHIVTKDGEEFYSIFCKEPEKEELKNVFDPRLTMADVLSVWYQKRFKMKKAVLNILMSIVLKLHLVSILNMILICQHQLTRPVEEMKMLQMVKEKKVRIARNQVGIRTERSIMLINSNKDFTNWILFFRIFSKIIKPQLISIFL